VNCTGPFHLSKTSLAEAMTKPVHKLLNEVQQLVEQFAVQSKNFLQSSYDQNYYCGALTAKNSRKIL
jgi:hypothetical protein